MKALSIKQPWAWLICKGFKDIENREWPIGRNSRHGPYSSYHQASFTIELPTRIYVHAGKRSDFSYENHQFIAKCLSAQGKSLPDHDFSPDKFGAIIGEVDITACVTESKSPWFVGKYGFVLSNPVLYETPIPYRGQLGFFEVDLKNVPKP